MSASRRLRKMQEVADLAQLQSGPDAQHSARERHGIYDPYTGGDAIETFICRSPHCRRCVRATHLKQTGCCEQASYTIQNTPDMVAEHRGRYLPKDKAAPTPQILKRLREAACSARRASECGRWATA